VLQDYNDIFALVTVPNLFLTWNVSEHGASSSEFDVTVELKDQFLETLHSLGIEFQFVVGAWGNSLIVNTLHPKHQLMEKHLSKYDLVLSSEGIYSLSSLPQFTNVLATCSRGSALVAAKKLYFGVGGGITEFLEELEKHEKTGKIVWEGGQVSRVIIQV